MNASKHEKNSAMFFSEKPHLSNFKKRLYSNLNFENNLSLTIVLIKLTRFEEGVFAMILDS